MIERGESASVILNASRDRTRRDDRTREELIIRRDIMRVHDRVQGYDHR